MAKKTTDSLLVKAAERVGRTAGKAAKGLDKVTAAAKALTGRKKPSKKVAKKVAKKAKPAATKATRKLANDEANKAQHGALVDERAHTRATAGQRWAARKPR
jgi:hypothetical protein